MNPTQDTQETLAVLGSFVLRFAELESILFTTVCVLTRVHPKIGQAIFSGTRAEASIQLIKRLFEVTDFPSEKKTSLADVFEHFGPINAARNLILHYGVMNNGGDSVSTNKLTALTESRIKSMAVTKEVLEQMTKDVEKMNATIMLNLIGDEKDVAALCEKTNFGSVSKQPWLYKPAPQQPLAKVPPQNVLMRLNPQKSSPA